MVYTGIENMRTEDYEKAKKYSKLRNEGNYEEAKKYSDLRFVDLCFADLSNANLSGADLSCAILDFAFFLQSLKDKINNKQQA